MDHLRQATTNLDALFLKAKKIHDQAGIENPAEFQIFKIQIDSIS